MSEIGLVALSMGTYCSMCRAMRTFDETAAALGAPTSLVALDDIHDRKLIVTRWQHGDVRVARSHADALRVIVNLKRTPVFHFVQAEYSTSITRSAGDITVVPPGDPSVTTIEGGGDIIQIFVEACDVGEFACQRPTAPLFELVTDDLRANAVGLFLATRGKTGTLPREAAARFYETIKGMLAAGARARTDLRKGGLKPTVLSRIDAIITAWLAEPRGTQPSSSELAEAARLSRAHFIRAFRETTGTTPYQYMMVRRRQRAMALLSLPDMSIAEVSDALGFSSPAHFIATFKQRFGATPGDYKQEVLEPA